jgi:hypothetical protein
MQAKFYGNMTGRFYDADDAVLWMPKGLLEHRQPGGQLHRRPW